ncbi:MAG: carbon starvation CstA family protein, partial [Cellulosilyticaceae bacterium]
MNGLVLLLLAIIFFVVAYVIYGGYLAKKWGIDPTRQTPAHTLRDDVDYCPADAKVVLGHQFSSIAGAGPITGPIQAIIFGWLPVFLWVVIGSIFIGGVHDWGSLFASIRHEGKSIGEVIKSNIGLTGKRLFNLFAWLTLVLVVAAFTDICAGTFAYNPEVPTDLTGAMAGTASVLFIFLAVVFGFLVYRKNANLIVSTAVGILLMFICIVVGYYFPVLKLSKTVWYVVLLAYIFCASILPVWLLLQPRDYLCSFLLYTMLAGAVIGIILVRPTIQMAAFNGFVITKEGASAQYLFPILFITVACGAVSGFHSLVSSGTASKQTNNEKDSKLVGYGAMLIEGIIAVIAIIAVGYLATPGQGTPAQQFANGVADFMTSFGLPFEIGRVFVTLAFSAFALTSLDTATRLGRYMFQELC